MKKFTVLFLLVSMIHICYGQRISADQRTASPAPVAQVNTGSGNVRPSTNATVTTQTVTQQERVSSSNYMPQTQSPRDVSYDYVRNNDYQSTHTTGLIGSQYGQSYTERPTFESYINNYSLNKPVIFKDASGVTFYKYSFANPALLGDKYALANLEIASIAPLSPVKSNGYILMNSDDDQYANSTKGAMLVGYNMFFNASNSAHDQTCSAGHGQNHLAMCKLTGLQIGHARGYYCQGCSRYGQHNMPYLVKNPCMNYLSKDLKSTRTYEEMILLAESYFACLRNSMHLEGQLLIHR